MQIYMETNYVKKNRGVTFCSALCQDDPAILNVRLWGGRSMTDFLGWIRLCRCFLAFVVSSVLTDSPTPLTEIQLQTMTEPRPCFTDGCKTSRCPPHNLAKIWLSNLDPSLHNTCCHKFSHQFLCNMAFLSLFPFLGNGFVIIDGSNEEPNVFLRSYMRSLLDFLTFPSHSEALDSCFVLFFSILLSSTCLGSSNFQT